MNGELTPVTGLPSGTTHPNLSFPPWRNPRHAFHPTWKFFQPGTNGTTHTTADDDGICVFASWYACEKMSCVFFK